MSDDVKDGGGLYRSLHPQNGRISDGGLRLGEYLNYHRFPPVFVAIDGDTKHDSPMCPELEGDYRMICREDALYAYGERRCETCWRHRKRIDFPANPESNLIADGGVEQEPVRKRDWISNTLEAANVVQWDRFVGPMERAGEEVIDVYGWIDRDDDHEDFVWLRFYLDAELCEYTTSSDEYSDYLAKTIHGADEDDLDDNHRSCRRVEDAFDVENAIELTEQQTLVSDGGLYQKYDVKEDGEPVEEFCFVLKPESDKAALEALQTYAQETDDRMLAADLRDMIHRIMANSHPEFFQEDTNDE